MNEVGCEMSRLYEDPIEFAKQMKEYHARQVGKWLQVVNLLEQSDHELKQRSSLSTDVSRFHWPSERGIEPGAHVRYVGKESPKFEKHRIYIVASVGETQMSLWLEGVWGMVSGSDVELVE